MVKATGLLYGVNGHSQDQDQDVILIGVNFHSNSSLKTQPRIRPREEKNPSRAKS
jgi:hypothetical protein